MPRDMRNITRLEGGKFRVRILAPDGRRPEKILATHRDAVEWRDAAEARIRRGGYLAPRRRRITLAEWDERRHHAEVRYSTAERNEGLMRLHVLPHFGNWALSDITFGAIADWIDDLKRQRKPNGQSYSPDTIHKIHQQLAKALRAALDEQPPLLDRMPNPPKNLPIIPRTEARHLSIEDGEILAIEEAMSDQWRLVLPVLVDTGLRIGELCALRWRDVDFVNGSVTVRATVTKGPRGARRENEAKTAAGQNRVIPTLRPETVEALRVQRGDAPEDAYVFLSPHGAPLEPHRFRSRVWNPAVAAAGIPEPRPTPHAIRHTAAKYWLADGYTLYEVAQFLGHASVNTAIRLYGHWLPKDYSEQIERAQQRHAAARALRAAQGASGGTVVSLTQARRGHHD